MIRSNAEAFLNSPIAQFKSWKTPAGLCPQGQFLRAAAHHKIRVFRSGNRVGKTTIGCVDPILDCLGWHPFMPADRRPPLRWWFSAVDWVAGVGQVIWPEIEKHLPMDQVQHISWYRKNGPAIPQVVTFRNGSMIEFKSADSGRKKYQGANIDGLWVDEEQPADVIEEARTRLLNSGGMFNVTLTPLERMRWVQDLERRKDVYVVRTSMRDAAAGGIIDPHELEIYAADLPERQRRVRVDGEFVALEGQVYPDLARETHALKPFNGSLWLDNHPDPVCPWPIPEGWNRYAAIDWGYANPTAVIVAVEDPFHGRLIIEKCFYSSGIRASRWARLLMDKRLPDLRIPPISDHDAQARAECEAEGLDTIAAEKDIDSGLECVERHIFRRCGDGLPGLMFVLSRENDKILGRCDAEKVMWESELYHYPSVRDGKPDPRDQPVKKDDHAMDALRYLVLGWERRRGGPPQPPGLIEKVDDDDEWEPETGLLSLPAGGWM